MSKHEPREGDRVKFNPAGTETVVEGRVTATLRRYDVRSERRDSFSVDGIMWATHPTRWTTDPDATDHETYLVENLVITRRRYAVGDVVDGEDLARLPVRTLVRNELTSGSLWMRDYAAGWKNLDDGSWRTHASLDSPDVGLLEIVFLP